MAACLRFTRKVWQSFLTNKGFVPVEWMNRILTYTGHDAQCFSNLIIERAVPGTVFTSLKVEQYNTNRVGTVHGGLILSLTDTVGSLAIATKGFFMTGVSTDIGTSFIRPAGRVGDILHANAVVTSMGKQLAYTRVDFTNEAGELVAYGHHTKYIGRASSHSENIQLSEDGETEIENRSTN